MKQDALYARFSSHAQDDGTSIAMQVEACERAAGKGLTHYIDQAKTGRTMGGRSELLRLIRDAEEGKIGRLYVHKFDRLGRAAETHVLVEDLEAFGVEVVSVSEGTNALARGVQLVVAADYSRVLAERTRAGLIQRHRQGCWTGGPAPYGYRVVTGGEGRKQLAVDARPGGEGEIVRFTFETYIREGCGFREIARQLRERGVATRLGGPWTGSSVRAILLNRMVVGEVQYLRRKFMLDRKTGRRVPRSSASRVETRREESLRLVSDEQFALVQSRVQTRQRPRGPRRARAFTGLLFCGACGAVCHGLKSENGKGAYVYYRCSRRYRLGLDCCASRGKVREDQLLERVRAGVAAVFEDAEGLLADVVKEVEGALESGRAEAGRLKSQLEGSNRTIGGLVRLLSDPDIESGAKRAIARQVAEEEANRETLQGRLQAAAEQATEDAGALMRACRRALEEARQNFAGLMTPAQANQFVAEVVGPITLLPDGALREGAPNVSSGNSGGILRGPGDATLVSHLSGFGAGEYCASACPARPYADAAWLPLTLSRRRR